MTMENYKFLTKPLFFIFNLIFATWLVIFIERLEPSDFGKYKSWFETGPDNEKIRRDNKAYLLKLAADYRTGVIDSVKLNSELERFLGPAETEKDGAR
jgi:hypothetical protein